MDTFPGKFFGAIFYLENIDVSGGIFVSQIGYVRGAVYIFSKVCGHHTSIDMKYLKPLIAVPMHCMDL
jgi:hypothetical protein